MSIFAPSSHSHKSSTPVLKLLVLFVSIIIGVFSVFPNTAQAAGESYLWVGTTNDRAILGTGGAFAEDVAFEYDGVHDGKQWYRPSGSFEVQVKCGDNEQTTSTLQTTTESPRIERDPDAPNATRLVVSGHRSPCGRGSTGGYLLSTGPMSVVNVADEKAACEAAGRVWKDNKCSITGNPETDEPETPPEEKPITCETSPDITPALRFVACPALEATTSSIWLLDDLVTSMLNYDVRKLEDSAARDAWRSFQIIAYSLVFIAGLVIVIGQAAGVQFLDAYTIKKALPRLVVAVVFIALSWELLLFFVAFMNQLGWWAQDLILEPFGENLKDMNAESAWTDFALSFGTVAGGATAAVGILVYMGTIGGAGVGLILLSWLVGILIVFAVVAIRTILITLGIVLAPVAIASMILPATQNLWELWRKAFITASTVFPLIMALLAMGKVAGDIMGWPLLPLLYIAPYFLIPAVFKLAGGLIGRIAGMVNDPSRGVFDRMRNARQGIYDRRKEELINKEQGESLRARGLGQIHRRNALMHQGGWSSVLSPSLEKRQAAKSRYAGAVEARENEHIAEKLKNDAWQSAGNDDATLVAKDAKTRDDFVKGYVGLKKGYTEADAYREMGRLENAFGDMGSTSMQLSTARARLMSPTANNVTGSTDYSASGRAQLHNDVVNTMLDMEEKGMARDTIINTVRSNTSRAEHAFGHSDWIGVIKDAKANRARGLPAVDTNLAARMDSLAAEQTDPYTLAKANDRTIRFLAHVETDRLEKMKQDHGVDVQITNAQGQPETVRTLDLKDRAVQQELATTMGRLDIINGQSPQKAKILADVLMRYTVGPTDKSLQIAQEVQNISAQMANTREDDPAYQNLRNQLEDAHTRYDLSTTVREVARTVFDSSNPQYAAAQQIRREYGSGIRANDPNANSSDPAVIAALQAQNEARRRQEEEQQQG